MPIRSLFLIVLLLCSIFPMSAQSIVISDFRLAENDLTANTHGTMLYDFNGEKCALIKVETTHSGFTFDAGMLGVVKTEQKPGEIWLYVPERVKRLTIAHPTFGILRDQDLGQSVQKGRTYILKLVVSRGASEELPGISYATMMSDTDPLQPGWINEALEKGYWMGVSLPTINRVEARKSALMNALLHYVFYEGAGQLNLTCHTDQESKESVQSYYIKTSFEEIAKVILSGFVVEVVNEYYNAKGEYFVLCKIGRHAESENALIFSRLSEDKGDRGKITFQSAMKVDGAEYAVNYSYTYDAHGGYYHIDSNQEVYGDDSLMIYPQMGQQTTPPSKGLFLLSQFAVLPIVAKSYQVRAVSMMSESNGETMFQASASYLARGEMLPLRIQFDFSETQQARPHLGVLTSGRWSEEKSFVDAFASFAQELEHRPQMFVKSAALYNAFVTIASLRKTNVSSVIESFSDETPGSNVMDSNSDSTISDFSVRWFEEMPDEDPGDAKKRSRKRSAKESIIKHPGVFVQVEDKDL